VAVIALNAMGEMYNNPSAPGQIEKQPMGVFEGMTKEGALQAEELNLDKSTLETIKAVYAAKERAVKNEDFDEAKRLKETIDRLKQVATHISQLEERKVNAIQSEDYEAAKVIKQEIEQLKQQCMYPSFQAPTFPPQMYG
jgi:centrosomal protein CEP104